RRTHPRPAGGAGGGRRGCTGGGGAAPREHGLTRQRVRSPRAMPPLPRPQLSLPSSLRRAVVVGAGSFGTAVAVLLARGGMPTTRQPRTRAESHALVEARENAEYLPGVELPRELRIEPAAHGLARADFV